MTLTLPPAVRRTMPVCLFLLLLLSSLFLTGCSDVYLNGTVVAGREAGVEWADSDDPRFSKPPVPDAMIEVTVDPQGMHPIHLSPVYSDDNGHFAVPMKEVTGAGILEYDMYIVVRATGYESAVQTVKPSLLQSKIIAELPAGADHYIKPGGDALDESLKAKDSIYNRAR